MPHDKGWKSGMGNYVAVVLSLTLSFTVVQAQSGAWTRKADMPYAKVGASACVVNGKIYVFGAGGCYASCHMDLAANRIYDPLTDTWESGLPLPTQRGYLSSAAVDDTIYAMGGGYPTLANLVTTVEAYDPATDSWNTKRDMLSPRFFAQAAVVDGIVYNIGGNYNQLNCEAYDPATNTWTRKKDRPEFGGALSVTAYNGIIYTFGGATYDLRPSSAVYAYDPPTDTWTKKKDMPTARFAFQTYLVNGKIYAIGGSRTGNTSIAAVEVYDPGSDTWQSKPNMPDELSCFGGAVVNDKIYVIGGTSDWVSGKSTVWEYDPAFHTEIAAGSVSGTWAFANSPYRVLGEITIPNDSTLMIEPGVEVVFMGHYKLNVQGRLLAVGTKKDTIRFTAQDIAAGWHGIRFISTPITNDTSKFIYCVFRNGNANTGSGYDRCGGAMLIAQFDRVLVSNCLFDSNIQVASSDDLYPLPEAGPAIYVYRASPVITNSTFTHHRGAKGSAIACFACPNPVISGNVLTHNTGAWVGPIVAFESGSPIISGNLIAYNISGLASGGISAEYGASPRIENNIIIHNQAPYGAGISCINNAKAVIVNNTIAYNIASTGGGGILCYMEANPILMNNILYGNTAAYGKEVYLSEDGSDPVFLYCNIQGGKGGFAGPGAGANYTALYQNNIDYDPSFVDTATGNFGLSDYSKCIGAGIDSMEVAGFWHHAPLFCLRGNPRPSPAGTTPDIGACENPLGMPIVEVAERRNGLPISFVLEQNYPNPFNPTTGIRYHLPASGQAGMPGTSDVRLVVYDLLGREVAVLVNEQKAPGRYEVQFDASQLASGVYVYRLTAGAYSECRKMVLMR